MEIPYIEMNRVQNHDIDIFSRNEIPDGNKIQLYAEYKFYYN